MWIRLALQLSGMLHSVKFPAFHEMWRSVVRDGKEGPGSVISKMLVLFRFVRVRFRQLQCLTIDITCMHCVNNYHCLQQKVNAKKRTRQSKGVTELAFGCKWRVWMSFCLTRDVCTVASRRGRQGRENSGQPVQRRRRSTCLHAWSSPLRGVGT